MLNIYYGSESVDKERFVFEKIAAEGGRTILIVPDQMSAQTERNAFHYLKRKALMDISVLDFDRLGLKAVQDAARAVPPLIDKYGRHMLLSGILRQEDEGSELMTYRGMSGRSTFVSMMNSLISEMKRNEVGPEQLRAVLDSLDDRKFLKRKLTDIVHIFEAYEEAIKDKYLDSEDYITFYGDAILEAPMIKGAKVWISGFDTFTPKNILVISRLIRTADAVNVVMDYEEGYGGTPDAAFLTDNTRSQLFSLTGYVIAKLEEEAGKLGHECIRIPVTEPRKDTIWTKEKPFDRVTMAEAADLYEEAECAATYILDLTKQGYRYRDMAVICNDMPGLGAVLSRTLQKWGIPVFMDKKRTVLHHPAVGFLIALMDLASEGYKTDAVMRLLKSGIIRTEEETEEVLENYLYKYRVRPGSWKNDFTRGAEEVGEETLRSINKLREDIVTLTEEVKDRLGRRNTAGQKIKGLYEYLSGTFGIEDRLEEIMERQQAEGMEDAASETAQSWNVLCRIFDQLVEVTGERRISNKELKKLMVSGLEEIEIGIVPADTDSILIGTLQRTRLSRNKVLMVIGANEGVLPMESTEEGILSETELEELENMDLTLAKTSEVMRKEEALAIYRNLTAPSERLYMSCARAGITGDDSRPSRIFRILKSKVAAEAEKPDFREAPGRSGVMSAVSTPAGTLGHLAQAIRDYRESGSLDPEWYQVIDWYLDHEDRSFRGLEAGLLFDNKVEKLGQDVAEALYMGDAKELGVSVSRLEKYSSCPFAHFISYGIRPEDLEPREIGARETGSIYHECLMLFSQQLAPPEGVAIGDPGSPWMAMDDAKCETMIRDIVSRQMDEYMKGTIEKGGLEEYRKERIISICTKVAQSLVSQVAKGHIKSMEFEKYFGKGSDIPPVTVQIGDHTILLRGIIDRLDVLDTPEGDAVRIVDYKTGNDVIKKEYYEAGYKLQLMVYMNAAMAAKEGAEPAGVFHFHISELDDADDQGKSQKESAVVRRDRQYRLKGFVINEENVIRAMDEDFEVESQVIPVKIAKDETFKAAAKGRLFTKEEFTELCEAVDTQVQRICGEITDGAIDIAPRRADKNSSACTFCDYRSICLFDTGFKGCRYVPV